MLPNPLNLDPSKNLLGDSRSGRDATLRWHDCLNFVHHRWRVLRLSHQFARTLFPFVPAKAWRTSACGGDVVTSEFGNCPGDLHRTHSCRWNAKSLQRRRSAADRDDHCLKRASGSSTHFRARCRQLRHRCRHPRRFANRSTVSTIHEPRMGRIFFCFRSLAQLQWLDGTILIQSV